MGVLMLLPVVLIENPPSSPFSCGEDLLIVYSAFAAER